MAIGPGCYILSPEGYEDVSAYCLDQSREPPRPGSLLSNVPASLDSSAVKAADTETSTLAQAVAGHAIQIEGLGNRVQLRIRNLTERSLAICITGPTIAMGNGETLAGDLKKIRDRIALLLRPPKDAASHDETAAHEATQQALWDAVNNADRKQGEAPIGNIPFATASPTAPKKPAPSAPRQPQCVGTVDTARLCFE